MKWGKTDGRATLISRMKLIFECKNCGNKIEIENPIVTKIKCNCGGIMKILTIQPKFSKNGQEKQDTRN